MKSASALDPPTTEAAIAPSVGALEEAAYEEYCRLRDSGAAIDRATFCARFPVEVREGLTRLLEAHEWLEREPELLDDLPAAWPALGSVWEGFELLEELGRGAFARVYLAREPGLGNRLVVVKATTLGPGEAATLGRLDHPHIVPIHYQRDLPEAGLTVVCMPYLGQATLQHVLTRLHGQIKPPARALAILDACRDDRLPTAEPAPLLRGGAYSDGVRAIAAQIAEALAYLHAHGLCHRDVKPSNILLQPDGRPRLLDFNLSIDTPRVGHMRLAGTMMYMAPEQLLVQDADERVTLTSQIDVFALGIILYEWLTGKHPYGPLPDTKDQQVVREHLLRRHQAGPSPSRTLASADHALARLVQRCLAYRPDDRPTAAEVARDLRRQLRPIRKGLRQLRRHPALSACAAILVCAAVALGAYHVAAQPPRHQVAYENGRQAYDAGSYRQAWEHFSQALTQGADEAECLFARARASRRLGEQDKNWFSLAMTDLRHAQERQPRGVHLAGMAYCAQRLQNINAAVIYYQQALAGNESAAIVNHNLGVLWFERSKLEDARRHFEQAVALDDSQTLSHTMLALTLFQQELRQPRSAVMPERLLQALHHAKRGLLEIDMAPADRALGTAKVYALAARYDPSYVAPALTWLERAVQAGSDPAKLEPDRLFEPLRTQERFRALVELPTPSGPAAAWMPILDPIP
jgi:serine/threonine protein kinase/Tfp pilus assembly protein PilF